jgi:hypothetical protein
MWSYADESGNRLVHRAYREQLGVEMAALRSTGERMA